MEGLNETVEIAIGYVLDSACDRFLGSLLDGVPVKTEWRTGPELFAALDNEFKFTLDVCALPWNAQCKTYFTPKENGLASAWSGVCWCNPPFDATQGKWAEKAWREAKKGISSVVLIAGNYHDTAWWHNYALGASELRYMRGRGKFYDEDGKTTSMRTIILIFHPQHIGFPKITSISAKTGLPSKQDN